MCQISVSNLSSLHRCGRCHNFVVRFWKAPPMNQQRKADSRSFTEMSWRNCATQTVMENDCRNWLPNPCAGFFRERLAFGARSGPTGLQFLLDCSFPQRKCRKAFPVHVQQLPSAHPKAGTAEPNQFSAPILFTKLRIYFTDCLHRHCFVDHKRPPWT